ncbi:MAG: hypothetical protein BWY09_01628 [Candidatus Hydrogenedentes bacterium ADurb.Bin179]|nr:MAG: hypothetical protein BWY09_01628 [Candidatus Hydrogenedentes bacterium ADurb.Bin179]
MGGQGQFLDPLCQRSAYVGRGNFGGRARRIFGVIIKIRGLGGTYFRYRKRTWMLFRYCIKYGTGDFKPVHEGFHHDHAIQWQDLIQVPYKIMSRMRDGHAAAGALTGGFQDYRQAHDIKGVIDDVFLMLPPVRHGNAEFRGSGDARRADDIFGARFVYGKGARRAAGTCVRTPQNVKESLQPSVLAVGAVQGDENTIQAEVAYLDQRVKYGPWWFIGDLPHAIFEDSYGQGVIS